MIEAILLICASMLAIVTSNIANLQYIIVAIGLILVLISKRYGFIYFICILFFPSDTPPINSGVPDSNVHTMSLGITIFPMYAMLYALILLASKRIFAISRSDKYMLLIISPWLLAAITGMIVGIFQGDLNVAIFISDLSFAINILVGYLIVRLSAPDINSAKKILYCVHAVIYIYSFYGIYLFFAGEGFITESIRRPVTDSFHIIFPYVAVILITSFVLKIGSIRRTSLIGLISLPSIALLFMYASRGNFLFIILCFLLGIVYLAPKGVKRSPTDKFSATIKLVLLTLFSLAALNSLLPGSLDYIGWKMGSLLTVSTDSQLISSSAVRLFSFYNIVSKMIAQNLYLTGTGLGGYFTDEYFPFLHLITGDGAFPDEWIQNNTLYKPHGTLLVLLLKTGLLGFVLYLIGFALLFKESLKKMTLLKSDLEYLLLGSLVLYLPAIAYKCFNTKLQVYTGIVIGILCAYNYFLNEAKSK